MTFTKTTLAALTVFAVSGLVVAGSPAIAQQGTPTPAQSQARSAGEQPPRGINLTLSPTFLTLKTDPGEEVTSQFKVTNNNSFPERLRLNLTKFEASPDGASPVIREMTEEDEYREWIEFSEQEFTLGPNQSKTIKVTITPPEEAALGYYYGVVVGRQGQSQAEGSQAVISGSAAISILLEVNSPNAKRELQVVDFKTDRLFYEFLPSELIVTVKNSGNIHVVPFGDIFIDSMFNKEVAVLPANKGRGNILPQSQRTFAAVWNDGFAVREVKKDEGGNEVKDGKGQPVYTTKYDFTKADKFRFGKYTANLLMVYDNGERDVPVEATVSFWVIPWRIILGILAVIAAPALLVFVMMRWKYKKR